MSVTGDFPQCSCEFAPASDHRLGTSGSGTPLLLVSLILKLNMISMPGSPLWRGMQCIYSFTYFPWHAFLKNGVSLPLMKLDSASMVLLSELKTLTVSSSWDD